MSKETVSCEACIAIFQYFLVLADVLYTPVPSKGWSCLDAGSPDPGRK